jgi:PST family polysaccharide transporter
MGGLLMAFMSLLLFTFSPLATSVILGHSAPEVILLIRILSILPLTIFIDNIYGTQILLNIGRERQFYQSVAISAIVTLVSLITLIPILGPVGAALSFLFSEILFLILMAICIHQAGVSLFLSTDNSTPVH